MAGHVRKLRWWIVAAVAVIVLLGLGGPFIYIHFIEGPPPAKLSLPESHPGSASSAAGSSSSTGSLDGTWNVGSGSVVGYRVQEVLIGQQSTAVGRTNDIWGSITISNTSVNSGSFTVNMATVTSDQSERNAEFDGRIMDVSVYPTARLVLTSPIRLGAIPAKGSVNRFAAAGTLQLHGVAKSVTFTVSAEHVGSTIDVLADIPILFADWSISNPSIGGFVTTQNSGTLEVLLHLTQGSGNRASSGSSGSSNGGGGGPVTVPSTTVPPLTVPTG